MVAVNDEQRLRTLFRTELLDSLPERAFDRLTRLAAGLLGVPVALVSLVDDHRQFFKSAVGLGEPWASRRETPLTHSFCQYAVNSRAPLVVSDVRQHPILKDNRATHELNVVAYAGMPLIVDDQPIGAFCAIDIRPRAWTEGELQILQDLTDSVVSEIELRNALRDVAEARALTEAILESVGDGVLAVGADRRFIVVNAAAREIFPRAVLEEPLPDDWTRLHGSRRPDGTPLGAQEGALARGLSGDSTDGLSFTLQRPGETHWIEASGRPVRSDQGDIVGAVAVYRDVTEKKRRTDTFATLAGNIPRGAVALFDDNLRCVALDGSLVRRERIDPDAMVGRPMAELSVLFGRKKEPVDRVETLYRRTLAGRAESIDVELGDRVLVLHSAPVRDGGGTITGGLVLGIDVTADRATAAALRRSEQVYRQILAHLPNGAIFMIDRDLRYVVADGPMIAGILERSGLNTLVGRRVVDAASDANRDRMVRAYEEAFAGAPSRLEVERDGRIFDLDIVPLRENDSVNNVLVVLHDVTERRRENDDLRRLKDELTRERTLLEATLDNIEDGIVLLDNDRRILVANPAFSAMFDFGAAKVEGMSGEDAMAQMASLVENREEFWARRRAPEKHEEFVFIRPRPRTLRRTWTDVELPNERCTIAIWHDITSEKELLAERERQLLVDALTAIPNRRAAEKAIVVEEARRQRANTSLSVAIIDVDHFKRVNDTFGHQTGDEVLKLVAVTLSQAARLTDTVARWGGEEFLAVLPVSLDGALAFAERVRIAVADLKVPRAGRITVSVGVAEVVTGETPADAIGRADERLYAAKRGGRNRVAS